jgi:hypothetical protein
MKTCNRVPYSGETRKLVVAIDVGTTFTAASFCILEPGQEPQFVEVWIYLKHCFMIEVEA